MKKYMLFLLVTAPLILSGLSFGPKSDRNPRFGSIAKPEDSNPGARLYPVEAIRSDLAEIKNILVKNHPAPYQFTGKEDFEKLYAAQLRQINRPMNPGEYFLIAAPLVESVHCGHTWISLPNNYWDNDEAQFLPLGLLFSGNKAYAALSANNTLVPPGSEILSINKIPISGIIESTKRLVNSDAKSKTGKLAAFFHSFPDLFALQYGNSERYEVYFIPPGNRETHVHVLKPVSRKSAWENTTNTLAGSFARGNELQLDIVKSKKLAVLTIGTFGYYNNNEKFNAFIDSAFEQIHRSGAEILILDLRNNGGGDPFCSAHLLSFLEKKPVPYFAHVYDEYKNLAQPIPLASKNSFNGRLRVLINGGCFSSTGHLCALLKYHGLCSFIGEETGGTYECNDSNMPFTTSAVKMDLHVATVTYTVAVKGLSRETGIMPDYPVEPTIGDVMAGRDLVKEFALSESDER